MPGVRAFRDPLAAPKNKGLTNSARGSLFPIMIARKPEDCLTGTLFLTAMKSFVEESTCRVRNSSSRLTPSPSMNRRASADTHLSIGYYSPSWPIGASPNGVVNYVGFLSEQLKAMGHHTTILAEAVAEGDQTPVFTIFRKSGPPSPEIR